MNFDNMQGLARALFEEEEDALFLCDPDNDQILDANSSAQRMTGFLLRDLLRMSVDQLFKAQSPDRMQDMQNSFRKTGLFRSQPGYALRSVQPAHWTQVSVTVSRLHLLPRTLVLIAARDLREHLQTCTRLENLEAERSRLFAAVPQGLWSGEVSAGGQLVYHWFSSAVERITGQPPAFFLAGSNRWWGLVHPQDRPGWERFLARFLDQQPGEQEYRLLRDDGTLRWVRETVAVFPEPGKPTRLHGTVTDITDHKAREQLLAENEERFKSLLAANPALASMRRILGTGAVDFTEREPVADSP
jgi:PAS domain S-box-containing protein